MKLHQSYFACSFVFAFVFARPTTVSIHSYGSLLKREVPQEHSHEKFLTTVRASLALNNPAVISDPVFGLLGNAAAAKGQGSIADTDCLQQATADQAFTNAKIAGNVNGMTAALVYRALERNSGTVGGVSAACTSIKATNPEIAAITQHQDPASANAATTNKAVTLALAKQIASVGGNPQIAIQSGTFAPGSAADKTGKGKTCDDANDSEGCIFTQKRLVPDVTAAESDATVGSASTVGGSSNAAAKAPASTVPSMVAGNTTSIMAASDTANMGSRSSTGKAGKAGKGKNGGKVDKAGMSGKSNTTAVNADDAAQNDKAATSGALDLGSCSDPSIQFGPGFDGRKEDSFQPVNQKDFNHGTALNSGVITGFICQQLMDKCKASGDTLSACAKGQQAAAKATGQAAANAFNAAFA
ncbi:MAG: hypothetical protein M1836_001210 [Candelina mexicana]|nr:MAG: hypothetical protein M1836_001210 [Candelina mexicana]